jgi:hypothetical protein
LSIEESTLGFVEGLSLHTDIHICNNRHVSHSCLGEWQREFNKETLPFSFYVNFITLNFKMF